MRVVSILRHSIRYFLSDRQYDKPIGNFLVITTLVSRFNLKQKLRLHTRRDFIPQTWLKNFCKREAKFHFLSNL